MNNKIDKKGSISLMILFFIIALSVIAYSSLRTNSYFITLAKERECYEKGYQLAQGLHLFILKCYEKQIKEKGVPSEITLFKNAWPDTKSVYNGEVLCIRKQSSKGIISTVLTRLFYDESNIITIKSDYLLGAD